MRINLIDILKEKLVGEYLVSVDDIGIGGVVMDVSTYTKKESVFREKYASSGLKLNIQNTAEGRTIYISWNRLSKFEFNIKSMEKK